MTDQPKILIFDSQPEPLLARLNEAMPEIEAQTCNSYDDLPAKLSEMRPDVLYSITFAGRAGYPRAAVLGPEGPRWIAVGGSGVDHLETWDAQKVTVTNAAGSAAAAMAEYALGTILHFTLDIPGLEADREAHHWNPMRLSRSIKGKTLLIVGLGSTGQAVAERAKAFGLQVIGTRNRPQEMAHVDEVHPSDALAELWPRADFIVLSVPLLKDTRGLVDARAFAAMKPSAILVDVSRGGVIEEAALIKALQGGHIAAAALDVFEQEPLPSDSPIWDLPNIVLSPHSSGVYAEWAMQSFELFLDNLRNWRAGQPLFNVVDPQKGY